MKRPKKDRLRLYEMYRQALVQICRDRGGSFKLDAPTGELLTRSGSLMHRVTEDGGIEFRHVFDDTSH